MMKLRRMDTLIRMKATGNQKEFAEKLSMSRSTLNEYLSEMKEMGFPIGYCRNRSSYFYQEDGRMVDKLFESRMGKDEMAQYKGGEGIIGDFPQSGNTRPRFNIFGLLKWWFK